MNKYKTNTFFRFAALSLVISIVIPFLLPLTVHAEERRVLRVAFPEAAGFSETAEDGSHSGLVVDYLTEISKYTNWEFEYVSAESDELINGFLAGEYDLMGSTYYSPDFEEYFAYPDYSCGYAKTMLITDENHPELKSYDLSSLNGKKIGVYKPAVENIKRLEQFLSMHDLDCELVYYTYEEAHPDEFFFSHITDGEVDMLLSSSTMSDCQNRVITYFDSQPHYIVAQPDAPEVLAELNMALSKILDSNPSFADDCYNANFSSIISDYVPFTQEELAYIAECKSLVVAMPNDIHPLSCASNDDFHNGLLFDFINSLSDVTGIEFTYVYTDSYQESLDLVLNGEADILGFFLGTEQDASDKGFALTQSYSTLNNIIMRNKSVNYPSDGLTAALIKGRNLPSAIKASKILYYDSLSAAMVAVNNGEADFVYGLSADMEQEMQARHYSNLIPVTLSNDYSEIALALSRPADTTLLPILNKGINQIPDQDKKSMAEQNMVSIGNQHFSLLELVYSNPIFFIILVIFIVCILLVTTIIVARTRIKSAVIQSSLERAQAESRAKSDFLSRMSHEIRTPMNAIMGMTDLTCMIDNLPQDVRSNLTEIQSSARYLLKLINDILDMSRLENGMLTISNEPFSLRTMLEKLTNIMSSEAKRYEIHYVIHCRITHEVFQGDEIRLQQVLMNLLSNAFKFTSEGGSVTLDVDEISSNDDTAVIKFCVTDNGSGIEEQDQQRIFKAFEQVGSNFSRSQGTGLGLPISSNILHLMGSTLNLESSPGKGSSFYFTLTFPLAEFSGTMPEEASSNAETLKGMRILLAEDNDLNATIAIRLLAKQGAAVYRVVDGKEAVEQFQVSPPGTYHVILMDIRMPVMDGLTATRSIRALEHPDAASIPIIAMTASSFQEDVDAAMAAGMTCFLTKPLDVQQLYRSLKPFSPA